MRIVDAWIRCLTLFVDGPRVGGAIGVLLILKLWDIGSKMFEILLNFLSAAT